MIYGVMNSTKQTNKQTNKQQTMRPARFMDKTYYHDMIMVIILFHLFPIIYVFTGPD